MDKNGKLLKNSSLRELLWKRTEFEWAYERSKKRGYGCLFTSGAVICGVSSSSMLSRMKEYDKYIKKKLKNVPIKLKNIYKFGMFDTKSLIKYKKLCEDKYKNSKEKDCIIKFFKWNSAYKIKDLPSMIKVVDSLIKDK